MTQFRHPAFAKLAPKIARAEREIGQMERFVAANESGMTDGDWGILSAASLGVHNVYNGIEDILLSISNDIDGLVPSGPSQHQDLLDQMSVAIEGTRPAVIDAGLYNALSELKSFRHLVRHRYGFDLDPHKVRENVERMTSTFPLFVEAIVSLEGFMMQGSDGAPGA